VETVIHITGAGVVSAVGCGQGETLDALRRGRSGIGPVRFLQTEEKAFPVGEVPLSNEEMAARSGASLELSRTSLMGILALEEALAEAGLKDLAGVPLISGTTVGGMDKTERTFPAYSPLHDCGASTDAIAAHFGGAPFATTLSTACSSAANAVIFGANLIRSGQAEIVAVGGSESLSDFHLHGFGSLMILDTAPCRPFDATRAGLNLGEGAAFLILESEASMKRRGAASLAVLSGFGNACDAFHQTASSENGEGAFLAMQKALKMAGLHPGDIDYVNAHGTGTPNNDASESAALKRVFGTRCRPFVHQGLHGPHHERFRQHRGGVLLLALRHGFIPAQLNWTAADPACIVPSAGGPARLTHILATPSVSEAMILPY
jgi:3-oxoacyl-(acyl-carrier-protein) synthase